ncbi:hypothetical protein MKZ38_006931 [Zalerion maritima]|uniref:CFEM domain-containing protein n=1 Tax=Zalerion maritima TaxID=339359 RepID=A0AAD5RX39_9PEZI|nr:hypothetical protein MKZ38_006931 [Zalerion maritima]
MKTTTLIALAAGLGEVAATFRGAKSFNCPSNTPETCDTQQEQGFDWTNLADGIFDNYGGFEFSGFECKSDGVGKRDALTGRTFGGKAACGVAEHGGGSSFGCGSSTEVDKFSIAHFDISVEFDVDLEFHYGMSDGSTCKHRSSCSKNGSTVKNSQCGGAQNVTVVYPSQSAQPSSTCSFSMHTISFSCGTPTATATSIVATTSDVETTPTGVEETSTEAVGTTSDVVETTPVDTTPAETTPAETTPAVTTPAETTPTEVIDTTSTEVEATTSEVVDTTASEVVDTSTKITSTMVTTFIGTSTVFETSVLTVTSCGPEIPDCPAGGSNNTVVVVTSTVAVSTTVCPITETQTTVIETTGPVETIPVETSAGEVDSTSTTEIVETTSNEAVESSTTAAESTIEVGTTTAVDTTSTEAAGTTTSSEAPLETLPCPGVVPSCLNTWMFTIDCGDNTDSSCYCPSAEFVENIFSCIYSYGESDDIIQEAVEFFQGICANYAGDNPAIATGAETITTIITVSPTTAIATATSTQSAQYTTVTVIQTTVVPCESDGTTLTDSSSTVVISTEMTVPQVTFQTTIEEGATTSDVVLIPGTTAVYETTPVATEITSTDALPITDTTLYTKPSTYVPSGTGVLPSATTSSPVQFTGAASPKGVAFGAIAFGVAGAIVGM